MNKLAIAATAAGFLLVSGLAIHQAAAQLMLLMPDQAAGAPLGERGAKWGNQCWKGDGYFGYWDACPKPKAAPKAAKRGKN
jgi:hypothetical protein